jgi:hypothetical protein
MIDQYPVRRRVAMLLGFSPEILLSTLKGIPYFLETCRKYRALNSIPSFRLSARDLFPILSERGGTAGVAEGHYFHQDLWAARKIHKNAPKEHFDVGSRIDGFVAHLLVFMPVTVIDIRKLNANVSDLKFIRDDATELSQIPTGTLESLSSLHAAEHFGLGRYSDPVDPFACFKFMNALQRVIARGGNLYFSVPVGRERVEFNAHRVFSPATIINAFEQLRLVSFSYVTDEGTLNEDEDPAAAAHCDYGCGLFHFTKPC